MGGLGGSPAAGRPAMDRWAEKAARTIDEREGGALDHECNI
jgi:hypothetical protein